MHLPLGGGNRALFIVAEYAVWLGMLIHAYGPGGATAAGLVRQPSCCPWRLGAVSWRPLRTADRPRSGQPGFTWRRMGAC